MSKARYSFFDSGGDCRQIGNDCEWTTQAAALAAIKDANLDTMCDLPWTLEKCEVMARISVIPEKLRIRTN